MSKKDVAAVVAANTPASVTVQVEDLWKDGYFSRPCIEKEAFLFAKFFGFPKERFWIAVEGRRIAAFDSRHNAGSFVQDLGRMSVEVDYRPGTLRAGDESVTYCPKLYPHILTNVLGRMNGEFDSVEVELPEAVDTVDGFGPLFASEAAVLREEIAAGTKKVRCSGTEWCPTCGAGYNLRGETYAELVAVAQGGCHCGEPTNISITCEVVEIEKEPA